MKREKMCPEEALKAAKAMPWAYVRSLSKVSFGPVGEYADPSEWLEARFFDGSREIRFFPSEEGLAAVCLEADPGDETLKEEIRMNNPRFGSRYEVMKILAADEDGQTVIADTLLISWKGAEA